MKLKLDLENSSKLKYALFVVKIVKGSIAIWIKAISNICSL